MKKSILFLALGLIMTLGAQAAEKKVYTSYNSSNNTLTYYYDDQYDSRPNVERYTVDGYRFKDYHDQIKKVVIDPSMKETHRSDLSKFFYGGFIPGGEEYPLSNLTTIVGMENLNTDEAMKLTSMFEGCESLKSIDLSHFNTANVTSMSNMFCSCKSLQSLNLSSFNTAKVTTMTQMFYGCESLQSLDLTYFNTAKLEEIVQMFVGCKALQSINLSSFHFEVDQLKGAKGLFRRCSNLSIIYCDQNWSVIGIDNDHEMFNGCYELRGEMGTAFNIYYEIDNSTYARPDQGSYRPGYFTRSGCYAPSGIQLNSVTDYTASISWKAPSAQYRWEVNYKPNYYGAETTTKEVTTTSCVLDKLRADYEYIVWIKGYCSETSGAYSPNFRFNAAKCQTPTNVVVSEISSTSAKISWSTSFAATKMYVRYYPKNNDAYYNEKSLFGTSCTLTDLTPGTEYYVYVVSECGSEDHMSDASAKASFTTSDCDTPTNVKTSNVTHNSVTVSWTPGSSQTKWKVGYYKDQAVGSPVYKYKTVTTPSCTLTDLAANTKYGVRVMALCGDDKVSAMSPAQNFTTLEKPCVAPTNLSISDITQSSATISWTPGNAADDKWVLYYKHENDAGYKYRIVSSNSYTLSDLRFNSKYYVSVATYCGEGKYSDESAYKSFTTAQKTDYVIVTSCAFKGFDHSVVQYGMTWTNEDASAIVKAMSPVDENAVYSLTTGGTLYKKNATGGAYTKVEAGNTVEEGIYIYVTMVNILPPQSDDYRFPKSDEGITVVVTVDDQQWNANPNRYMAGEQVSQITMNSPDFTVSAPDPQALADARETLEEMIDDFNLTIAMLNELGIGADIISALTPIVASAQAVLDNPNATLAQLQEAILTLENAAATYEATVLELLAPIEFEAVKQEAIEHLDLLLLPDDDEACKKIIEDAKAYVASLTYDTGKTPQENIDYLENALMKLYHQVEEALERARAEAACVPPTDFKVSNITATSATLSWIPGSPRHTKFNLIVYGDGYGYYLDDDFSMTAVTLTDLKPNTEYQAEVSAYCDNGGSTDWAAPGWLYFTTSSPEGISQTTNDQLPTTHKLLRNGQLLILRGNKTYNAQGVEVF